MHVRFLGTASGYPVADRFGETVVIDVESASGGSSLYLLDAGDGASSLLHRYGYDHTRIRAIVISHMHADHHTGFAQVVKTGMHLKRSEELVVFAPREGIPALQAYLKASYLTEMFLGYPIRWVPLSDAIDAAVTAPDGITIRAYSNEHLASARIRLAQLGMDDHGYAFESYSIVLERDDLRIVYSGNLNGPKGADELISHIEPADVLICELAHLDPAELGRVLAGRAIGRVLLAHFHPKWTDISDQDLLKQIQSGAAGAGSLGDIQFAVDGAAYEFIRESGKTVVSANAIAMTTEATSHS